MTKAKTFLILSLFFIAGVGLRSLADVPFVADYIFLMVGIVGVILFWKNKRARIICFGLIFLALGIFRYELATPKLNSYRIEFYNGQKVSFVGVVSQEPDVRSDHVKLTIATQGLSGVNKGDQGILRDVRGKVLINTYLYPEYEYGNKLAITCELQSRQSTAWVKGPRLPTRGYPHRRMSEQKYYIWQPSFYDFNIYSNEKLEQKVDYVNNNAAKHNLVDDPVDWKFCSARNYYLSDDFIIKIDRIEL